MPGGSDFREKSLVALFVHEECLIFGLLFSTDRGTVVSENQHFLFMHLYQSAMEADLPRSSLSSF